LNQKQELIAEMNQAKRAAADRAAEPYLESIAKIDETYSLLLTFLGNNKDRELIRGTDLCLNKILKFLKNTM
jgi:hypothetical protein